VSVAQAAPPLQEGDSSEDSTFGETLDLDDVDDDGGKNNLGSIMSGKNNPDDTEADVPEDGDPEDGDPEDGDPEDGDPEDGDPEDGDPEDGDPEDGSFKEHPVASALAEYFKDMPYFEGASYDEAYNQIMELHQAGNGFGNITKAYFFAEKLGMTPDVLLAEAHISGWGNVLKAGGIHPGLGNGGKNKPDHAGPPDKDKDNGPPGQNKKTGDSSELVGQGNGNGNGNGNKGGNGQGNGNKGGKDKGNGKGGGKGNNK
jgi:hypothetical protein